MSFKKQFKDNPLFNPPQCILNGYRGSIAHGMYVPQKDPNSIDDKDIMTIIVPGEEYYFGLKNFGSKGTKEIFKDEWDIVIYEAKKFISLLNKSNPNVISLLWLEPKDYICITNAGKMLIENRDLFSTKQVYHSFVGYAHGQAHRMTHMAFEGYMGEKRKTLVKKFGYDCKNAAHLIRLLRMGIEFLTEGILYVKRKDASQLLEIKKGEWSLEQVQLEADRLFKLAEEAYVRSKLPSTPNFEKVNQLSIDVIKEALYGQKFRTQIV
jgi:uncharacterized protein